jgi:hypothetical protein
MSLFSSEKERESLRKEYIKYLKSLNSEEIEYTEGYLWWKKKWTVKNMIVEMKYKTVFSDKILENIQANRIFTD